MGAEILPLYPMKILILRSTIADRKAVDAGHVYDVSDEDATFLIRLGKAVQYVSKPKTPKATD